MVQRSDTQLIGAIGMDIAPWHDRAEVGYWVGVPYWNHGYATEALRALIDFGFGELGLHRIQAHHLARNPASGRVMLKAGLHYEGTLREYVKKAGRYENLVAHGLTREMWRREG